MDSQVAQIKERRFKFDGKVYTLRFTQNALLRLGELVGMPVAAYFRIVFKPGEPIGTPEWQRLLWACLEGARLKDRNRRSARAWDIYEVGDLLEDILEKDHGLVFDMDTMDMVALDTMVSECLSAGYVGLVPRAAQQEEEGEIKEATPEELEEAKQRDPTSPANGDGS